MKGGKRKRKDACRYTNKLNYDKLFPTSKENDPSKLLQLKINKRMLCDFSGHAPPHHPDRM